METTHTILVTLTQRVDGYTLDDLADLENEIKETVKQFVKPEFEGDTNTILEWDVETDGLEPGPQPELSMFPRRFDCGPSLGLVEVKFFEDETVKQFDYVFVPKLGVYNLLNPAAGKLDKTGLCKAADAILRKEGYAIREN